MSNQTTTPGAEVLIPYACTLIDPKDIRSPWASMVSNKHGGWYQRADVDALLAAKDAELAGLRESHAVTEREACSRAEDCERLRTQLTAAERERDVARESITKAVAVLDDWPYVNSRDYAEGIADDLRSCLPTTTDGS